MRDSPVDREWCEALSARLAALAMIVVAASLAYGCSTTKPSATTLSREELMDPSTCGKCHEDHFRDWSGSMHAYAAEDPIFLAMNKKLQRQTGGALGNFCIRCHAPMAVRDGKSNDGLNLADLPAPYRGVTCFFCHTTASVGELHNNGLIPGDATTMRGPFDDAVKNDAHQSTKSVLHDGRELDSPTMCGSCHDIDLPDGVHVERTFAEWKQSLFATETGQTCGSCHMQPSAGLRPIANTPGVFARSYHSHAFAGVDRALTSFPNKDDQKAGIQELLDASIQASLCVSTRDTSSQARVVLDNVFAGHTFPSGSSADRRVWVELVAMKAGQMVYESGVVPDGTAVRDGQGDKDLWLLRDVPLVGKGQETDLFGLASCYESRTLPFPVTANPKDPRYYQRNIVRDFPVDGSFFPLADTVTIRIRILPVGLEVLDGLIATGDLDPALRSAQETMQVGPTVTWKPGVGKPFTEPGTGTTYECVTETNQNYRANKFPPPIVNTCQP